MPFTFGDLIAELSPAIWPSGEAENLVIPHRRLFIEALIDLQQYVECLQINNTTVIPQCNTLFKCGMTVIDAPRGHINHIYVIDKINQETGLEDASASTDWCSLVDYRQVEYADIHKRVSQTLAGCWGFGDCWGWAGLNRLIAVPFAACWQNKYYFPPPTDYGLENAPPLPLGFHYPQDSTDAPNGQRALWGMWAIRGGQIYIAPWIQSTETVVVEWDGIKRTYNDLDLVDEDPLLKKAVEHYVRFNDLRKYQHDFNAADTIERDYNVARADMIHECREENRIRSGAQGTSSMARGAAQIVLTFFNEPQTATAKCDQGTTGNPVTVTIPAGTVSSRVSVADANSQARSLALQQAGQQLVCEAIPVTYYSRAASKTARCPLTATGNPVTVTIEAGRFTSIVSQDDADNQAIAEALAEAVAGLECTYFNVAKTVTAHCPAGHAGADVTRTVAAGTYTSTLSQKDADDQAEAAATVAANAALSCAGDPPVYTNTVQTVTGSRVCSPRPGHPAHIVTANVTVPAGMFSSQISQKDANDQALAYGNLKVNMQLAALC